MELIPVLLLATLLALAGGMALGIAAAFLRDAPAARFARLATMLATLLLAVALVARTVQAGRAPWSNLQETATAFAFFLLAVFLLLARRHRIEGVVPLVCALAAGLVALAVAQPNQVQPLVPALQAPLLLTLHVGSAIAAYAIGGVAFVAAVAELVQRRGANLAFLPSPDVARAAAHRAVLVGFPLLTAAIVLGSVWANLAWRSYWSNDPKELAAAATWLVYAGYLHAAVRRDRWAGIAPWLLVLGFAAVLFTWLGAGLVFVGEHSYAGA